MLLVKFRLLLDFFVMFDVVSCKKYGLFVFILFGLVWLVSIEMIVSLKEERKNVIKKE